MLLLQVNWLRYFNGPIRLLEPMKRIKKYRKCSFTDRALQYAADKLDCDIKYALLAGKGEIVPVGPTSFEFMLPEDYPISIHPMVGTVEPGKVIQSLRC